MFHSFIAIRLWIFNCDLDELPHCISLLLNLEVLGAYNNNLKVVPVWLQDLPLKTLNFEGNQIGAWPPLRMPHLTRLFLSNNELLCLPSIVRDYQLYRYLTSGLSNYPFFFALTIPPQYLPRLESISRFV